MRDFMGVKIELGDKCLILKNNKSSAWFTVGTVKYFTPSYIRTEHGLSMPDKVIVINDDFYNRIDDNRKSAKELNGGESPRRYIAKW